MSLVEWFGELGDAELAVQLLHLAEHPRAYDDEQWSGLLQVAAGRIWNRSHQEAP